MGTGQGVSQPGAQRCPLLGTQVPAQPVWAPVPALPLTVTPTELYLRFLIWKWGRMTVFNKGC